YQLGAVYARKGETDRAMARFGEAIRLKIDRFEPYYMRGIGHAKKGSFDHALADFMEVIRRKPDLPEAYGSRGLVYSQRADTSPLAPGFRGKADGGEGGEPAERSQDRVADLKCAIADFTEAIRLQPDLAQAYNDRGRAYAKLGDADRA